MQQQLRSEPAVKKRAKTVYAQRNLGTIRERKKEKKQEAQPGNAEIILRILRMRPGTSEFIKQQLDFQASAQAEQEKKATTRRAKASKNRGSKLSPIPPVPALPS
ncbi:hypothetical protein FRC02_004085 [Tulasnella sp. 418]|nr:hypothetical protein FRC02_004085 [Tulasnella sp. 418]